MIRRLIAKYFLRNFAFDPQWYLLSNPDVREARIDPYLHFWYCGRHEGRLPVSEYPDNKSIVCKKKIKIDPNKESILLVLHEGSRTGAPILGYNLAISLKQKYNIVCAYFKSGEIINFLEDSDIYTIGPISYETLHQSVKKIKKLTKIKYAIINSIESRYLLKELVLAGIPCLTLVHEFVSYTRPSNALLDTLYWSSITVFSSALTRQNALDKFPYLKEKELLVLPQGQCIVPLKSSLKGDKEKKKLASLKEQQKEKIIILGAGFCQYRKGVDIFLSLAQKMKENYPEIPFQFIWVGKGFYPENDIFYSAYLLDQMERAHLEQNVCFLEEVEDLTPIYDQTDIFLLSSRLDPLPNVAIDAIAKGIPLVCFAKATGIANILEEAGLEKECVSNYLDIEDMGKKLLRLATSQSLRNDISQKFKKIAHQEFHFPSYAKAIDRLGVNAVEKFEHEKREANIIDAAKILHPDFSNVKKLKLSRAEITKYIRSWRSGQYRRKPYAEFHPGIYQEEKNLFGKDEDPLAHFIKSGKPEGRWKSQVFHASKKSPKICNKFKVALHIHAFYPDMLSEIIRRLERNKTKPDLLISVPESQKDSKLISSIQKYKGKIEFSVVENRGRDLAPFLTDFAPKILQQYEIIGHFHTKKSLILGNSIISKKWIQFLLENLLGGKLPMVDLIMTQLAQNPSLGLVFPNDPHVNGWDDNFVSAQKILQRLKITHFYREFNFPIGNMFWARTAAIQSLLNLKLTRADYPKEPLPNDGSLLHALERITPFVVEKEGYQIMMTHIQGVTR